MKQSQTILITGANGFIGRHLTHALAGHKLILSTRDQYPYNRLKFTQLPPLHRLYHLAWSGSPALNRSDLEEAAINLEPTKQLVLKAKQALVKHFVFVSSVGAIIGEPPKTPYGRAKLALEHWLLTQATPAFKITIVRATNAIGIGQHYKHGQGLLPYLKQALLTNKPATLYGNSRKDYLDVRDLAAALAAVSHQPKPFRIYPVGSGTVFSTHEIVRLAETTTGKSLKIIKLPARPDDPQLVTADLKLVQTELNWQPLYDPKVTIREYFKL